MCVVPEYNELDMRWEHPDNIGTYVEVSNWYGTKQSYHPVLDDRPFGLVASKGAAFFLVGFCLT